MCELPNISDEIAFKLDVAREPGTRADFTYKITPNTISITDTTLGKLSVTKDIDAFLRRIEHSHQASIAAFKIMYRDEHGVWNGVRWNGNVHPFSLCAKPMRKRRWQNYCAKIKLRPLTTRNSA